jgi:hypothetical protein
MRFKIFCLTSLPFIVFGQSDAKMIKDIKKHVYFLANDKLEGRRTGTLGEKKAWGYLSRQFKKNNISPLFEKFNGFVQPFTFNEGVEIDKNNFIKSPEKVLTIDKDFFPLPYTQCGAFVFPNKNDAYGYLNIGELVRDSSNNPHFDLDETIYQKMKSEKDFKDKKIVFVYNSNDSAIQFKFNNKNKRELVPFVAVYCDRNAINNIKHSAELSLSINILQKNRTGLNVAGWINNNASKNIIIGAHYDHLGYGEDHNSLYTGKVPIIHNGADDNASGTAALLTLSKIIKKRSNKNFNYIFVAFSGEELGLYGSKYFTEHCPVDIHSINYMINMDMIGRLNDSTHGLTIGGFGTSPSWGKIIDINDEYFKIKVDSSGIGPSDHTSFYKKDVPVLFFFTGVHSDYHKPTDDADKINYKGEAKIIQYILSVINKTKEMDKLFFTKTKENINSGKSSFKVTMGIMPDYTFNGNGVMVDGVSDNRPAQKAGVQIGDIIYQLGNTIVSDVQSYMEALSKFKKGDAVNVKIKRGNDEIVLNVVF